MLRFTTRSSYGVRALIGLAAAYESGEPVSLKTISKKEGISLVFLEQIFNTFRKAGIVKSTRGPRGGYVLARDPSEMNAGDIIRVLEGDFYSGRCISGGKKGTKCGRSARCASKEIWDELTREIERTLARFSLEYLADRAVQMDPERYG